MRKTSSYQRNASAYEGSVRLNSSLNDDKELGKL